MLCAAFLSESLVFGRDLLSDEATDYLEKVFLNKHRKIRENYVVTVISEYGIKIVGQIM